MKKDASFTENIQFLIAMYKKLLDHEEELTMEQLECYKNIIFELEEILKLSK